MGLQEAAKQVPVPPGRSPFCTVGLLLERIDADDRAWLFEQFAAKVSLAWVAQVLRAAGHDVGAQALRRHRRGECACR